VSSTPIDTSRFFESERWISRFTLIIGLIAAIPVGWFHGFSWGAGILIGAVLAWFNFRWLAQGLDALTAASTAQAGQPKPHVPVGTYFKAMFRYGLIALAVYVIFEYLNVPILSMIFGLCALGAATMAVSVYEILRPQE
jgi:small-conductance mechanosensitive channel